MDGPKCYNTVIVIRVKRRSGLDKLRHEKFDEDIQTAGAGVRCPASLYEWLIPRGGQVGAAGVGDCKGSTRKRKRRKRKVNGVLGRISIDGRIKPPKGESSKRLNYYELEIQDIHYQVYPTTGTITVTGIPGPGCVPLMLDALSSATGLEPEEIDCCEAVNATYSGQLTYQQCGLDQDVKSFLRDGLEAACREAGLYCSYRHSQFSGAHIKSCDKSIRGTLTLFKSGKYNILGVKTCEEAYQWHKRICAVIGRC